MSIVVRGCHIGEGRPKVIVPIVETTESKILERAFEFSRFRIDCVESCSIKGQASAGHLPHQSRGRKSVFDP